MADGVGPGILALPGIEDVQPIGRGGSATLYRGRQPAFHRDVAVKILDAVDDSVGGQFSKELRALGSLSGHRHVVPVYDAGELDGHPYLVMPFLSGGSLADRIRAGPLPAAEVVDIGLAVADALVAAHALEMLHRDIKPANVLFTSYGEAQLADFGIARFSDSTQTYGLVRATVGYAAPEVLAGEPATPAADVYSLGATLHAALRGAPPYVARPEEPAIAFAVRVMQGDPPPLANVPPALAAVVERAMAKEPGRRYATAADFRSALADADTGGLPLPADPGPTRTWPVQAQPVRVRAAPTRTGSGGRRPGRGRMAAGLVGLLLLVGGGLTALALAGSGRGAPRSAVHAASGAAATTLPPSTPASVAPTDATPATRAAPATTAADTTVPPAAGGAPGAGPVTAYVDDYYALVDAHALSRSWTWLSPAYQQRLGYAYYQRFWNSVRSVTVLSVSPGSSQATVTLRYAMTDGSTQTERAQLAFVTASGRRLIDNTTVIG